MEQLLLPATLVAVGSHSWGQRWGRITAPHPEEVLHSSCFISECAMHTVNRGCGCWETLSCTRQKEAPSRMQISLLSDQLMCPFPIECSRCLNSWCTGTHLRSGSSNKVWSGTVISKGKQRNNVNVQQKLEHWSLCFVDVTETLTCTCTGRWTTRAHAAVYTHRWSAHVQSKTISSAERNSSLLLNNVRVQLAFKGKRRWHSDAHSGLLHATPQNTPVINEETTTLLNHVPGSDTLFPLSDEDKWSWTRPNCTLYHNLRSLL